MNSLATDQTMSLFGLLGAVNTGDLASKIRIAASCARNGWTKTFECASGGQMLTNSHDQVKELCFPDLAFGALVNRVNVR